MKIYVVSGSTGEYSDHNEWMVRAYTDEATAQAIVVEYTAKAKEIEVRAKLPKDNPQHLDRYKHDFGVDGRKWPHPDPGFQMDYTGTDYAYCEIELVGTGNTGVEK